MGRIFSPTENASGDATERPEIATPQRLPLARFFEAHADLILKLTRFDPTRLIAFIGGLLTVPEWHASKLRLEFLQHFAVAVAQGAKGPKAADMKSWLTELGHGFIGRLEDPAEDVFVSRIILQDRDCLVFEGLWESSAFCLQRFLNVLGKMPERGRFIELRRAASALLSLSNAVAARSDVKSFDMGQTMPLRAISNRLLRNLPEIGGIRSPILAGMVRNIWLYD